MKLLHMRLICYFKLMPEKALFTRMYTKSILNLNFSEYHLSCLNWGDSIDSLQILVRNIGSLFCLISLNFLHLIS